MVNVLTLSVHAQQGLQHLVAVSVHLLLKRLHYLVCKRRPKHLLIDFNMGHQV